MRLFKQKGKLTTDSTKPNKLDFVSSASLKRKADEILISIINGKVSREEIEWLENVNRIVSIKKHFSNTNSRVWRNGYAIVALVCIIIGGLLLIFRVGDFSAFGLLTTNNVTIQVRCKALETSLMDVENTNIIGFDKLLLTNHLEINNLNALTVTNTALSFYDSTSGLNAKLSADSIFVDEIELGRPSVLRVRHLQNILHIFAKGGKVKVAASFNNAEFFEPVKEKVHSEQKYDIPLFARFESDNNGNKEVGIKLRPNGPVNLLEGKKINSLSFFDSYVYGADILKYISTIQSGTLTLNDVNRSIDLHKQDRFVLDNIEGWIIDFTVENGIINLFFKGTVKDIRSGPAGSEKDLSPSLLEYFFKNQPLTLFWGAIVFLWSLLSNIVSHYRSSGNVFSQ